jgi:hypothetical protein
VTGDIVRDAAELAREIDRLVIAGHEAAAAFADQPDVVRAMSRRCSSTR